MGANRETVVIVDDDYTNLAIGRSALSDMYRVFTAPSGEKLLLMLQKITPDLILLDIEMPEMDGFEVIKRLKSSERTRHIPVIFLTGKNDPESEVLGLDHGAVDYIAKPFTRELLIKRVELHIIFERQKKELIRHNLNLENEVYKKTKTVVELQNAILNTVAELVECRDNVTGGHIERTQHYLGLLIGLLNKNGVYADEISGWDVDLLIMSSQLHDVGKISIKDDILLKPGKLTEDEFEEMKKHTTYGVEIIRRIERSTTENEFLFYAEILAGSHHERWDGKGYPYGLKGQDIPLHGRLMAIIDVYDALTNDRPYKKAFPHDLAVEIIREGNGTQFDPVIEDIFLRYEEKFSEAVVFDQKYSTETDKLQPTMKVIYNVVGTRAGKEYGHSERIRAYLEIMMDHMLSHDSFMDEVSGWDRELFLLSAQMHDVGKIAIADNILNKAEALSEEEFDNVKYHVDFGVKVVEQVKENVEDSDLLFHAEMLAGSHHEKWDGSGYPRGLKGENIPLQGRVMAIVDVYEALTTDRPHRSRKSHVEAIDTIMSGSGTHFDPDLVDVFLDRAWKFEEVNI